MNSLKDCSIAECNELAFTIIEKELRINRVMSASESVTLDKVDSKLYLNYLEQVCEYFRGEIPHVKHPKLDFSEFKEKLKSGVKVPDFSRLLKFTSSSAHKSKSPSCDNEIAGVTNKPIGFGGTTPSDDRSRRLRKSVIENHGMCLQLIFLDSP